MSTTVTSNFFYFTFFKIRLSCSSVILPALSKCLDVFRAQGRVLVIVRGSLNRKFFAQENLQKTKMKLSEKKTFPCKFCKKLQKNIGARRLELGRLMSETSLVRIIKLLKKSCEQYRKMQKLVYAKRILKNTHTHTTKL